MDELKHVFDTIKSNISEIERRHGEILKATSRVSASQAEIDLQKLMAAVGTVLIAQAYCTAALFGTSHFLKADDHRIIFRRLS